jgi:hypothetical protein
VLQKLATVQAGMTTRQTQYQNLVAVMQAVLRKLLLSHPSSLLQSVCAQSGARGLQPAQVQRRSSRATPQAHGASVQRRKQRQRTRKLLKVAQMLQIQSLCKQRLLSQRASRRLLRSVAR